MRGKCENQPKTCQRSLSLSEVGQSVAWWRLLRAQSVNWGTALNMGFSSSHTAESETAGVLSGKRVWLGLPAPPSQLQLAAAQRTICLFLSPPTTVSISGGVMAALLSHLFKYILAYIKSPGSFLYTHFRRRLNGIMRLRLSSSLPHNASPESSRSMQLKCQSCAALTALKFQEQQIKFCPFCTGTTFITTMKARWNICWICWIYHTCPSGRMEPLGGLKKGWR